MYNLRSPPIVLENQISGLQKRSAINKKPNHTQQYAY
jgi:hypothetical protein